MYADNQRKLVIVLNKREALPVLLNAAIHAVAGLVLKLPENSLELLDYRNRETGMSAFISRYPNVVLQARNTNQLKDLYMGARDQGLAVNPFTLSMLGASAEDQMRQTQEASSETLGYIAVALFGEAHQLAPLTKRFSVFSGCSKESPA